MTEDSADEKVDFSCDEWADKYNVPRDRALVWHALSNLFLDCSWSEEELAWMGQVISETNFTIQELSHIVSQEVAPVCSPNQLFWVGGEGALGFSLDWLMEKCGARMASKIYAPSGNLSEIPWILHLKSPLFFEAYLMLYRVQRIRLKNSN